MDRNTPSRSGVRGRKEQEVDGSAPPHPGACGREKQEMDRNAPSCPGARRRKEQEVDRDVPNPQHHRGGIQDATVEKSGKRLATSLDQDVDVKNKWENVSRSEELVDVNNKKWTTLGDNPRFDGSSRKKSDTHYVKKFDTKNKKQIDTPLHGLELVDEKNKKWTNTPPIQTGVNRQLPLGRQLANYLCGSGWRCKEQEVGECPAGKTFVVRRKCPRN